MPTEPVTDPNIERCIVAAVDRGDSATTEEAQADFWYKLDRSLAQAHAGELIDAEIALTHLRERYANWPRAAAE